MTRHECRAYESDEARRALDRGSLSPSHNNAVSTFPRLIGIGRPVGS